MRTVAARQIFPMKWARRRPDDISQTSLRTRRERAWNGIATSLIFLGVLTDIGLLGWTSVVRAVVPVTVAYWVLALCVVDDLRARWRRLVAWSLIVPVAVVAFVGYWALAQAWAVAITVSVIAFHPYIVAMARSRLGSSAPIDSLNPSHAATSAHDKPAAAPKATVFGRPARMSDDALRQCWEASWALLQRAATLSEAVRIVSYRESCLDEIERRSPGSFRLWLEAGAPNADEPARRLPPTFSTRSSS
jgi:hypothetical protein